MAHSIIYVSDGTAGGLTKGKIASIVQGQSGQSITLEVRDLGNNLVDLTGYSTITGRKRDASGNVTALVGTLTLSGTPTVAPQVTFALDEDDGGESGFFTVIIILSNGVNTLKSFPATWHIQNDPAVNATTAAGTVGVTETQASLLASLATTTGLAEFNGTGGRTAIVIQSFMRTFLAAATVIAARIGLLPSYTGNTGKVLAVNGAETDVEWVAQSGGGGGGDLLAANNLSELTATQATARTNIGAAAASDLTTHESANTNVHGIANTSALVTTGDIGSTVQAYSAKTAAITALTWAANSVIWLTGTTTAIVQTFAAHVVTFLQSADAAAARTAIGAGTGNGDLLAANNLSELTATASTARTNIGAGTGNGDVTGPGSSVDNQIVRFDLTTGKIIQAGTSAPTYDDTGKIIATVPISSYSSAASGQAFGDGATSAASGAALGYQAVAASTSVAIGRGAATSTNHVAVGYSQITTGIAGYVTKLGSQSAPGSLGHFWIYDGVDSTARIAMPDTTGDVLYGVGGMFFVRDSAGNIATGAITATAPGGTFNLYDDGGTNTLQLQVSAGGAITVQRTAGSRTYKINLSLIWL